MQGQVGLRAVSHLWHKLEGVAKCHAKSKGSKKERDESHRFQREPSHGGMRQPVRIAWPMATLQRDEKRIAGRQISATAIHIFDWYRTPEATQLNDGADVPDTLQITYQYPGFILSYEASMLNGYGLGAHGVGRKYYGARGPDDRPHVPFTGPTQACLPTALGSSCILNPRDPRYPD